MNQKELKELIEFLIEKDIAEFELERGDVKVRVKRGVIAAASAPETRYAAVPQAPAAAPAEVHSSNAAGAAAVPTADEGVHNITSPIVGTFYESPSPGSAPFVKPGDSVEPGMVLCIIEAMKLMNEIESDVAGELVKILVQNGQPVEYGQPLFAIRTRR
ncbi:MAG TPA: acetyl-CoA carboxylase biotin carboxyl carrier protein [Terriglobales bacterium]|nr:acetyl-CoA carboxylase biotin carboxyl carrier protein [Terriglobales bacterium]